jgi:hypothetical protein
MQSANLEHVHAARELGETQSKQILLTARTTIRRRVRADLPLRLRACRRHFMSSGYNFFASHRRRDQMSEPMAGPTNERTNERIASEERAWHLKSLRKVDTRLMIDARLPCSRCNLQAPPPPPTTTTCLRAKISRASSLDCSFDGITKFNDQQKHVQQTTNSRAPIAGGSNYLSSGEAA